MNPICGIFTALQTVNLGILQGVHDEDKMVGAVIGVDDVGDVPHESAQGSECSSSRAW